ncbi:MAG: hypothetical protein GY857_20900, partial [Desulfobacula sp.]|nr:hypothetical protein [Desulfobacula sp.]
MVYKKKQILTYFISILFMAGLTALLAGCGAGLPKDLKSRAKNIPAKIKAVQSQVDKLENKYKGLEKSREFTNIKKFAIKENWAGKFDLARDELNRAKGLYDKDLLPLVKKNKPELVSAVQQQIARINKSILHAENLSKFVFSRFALITDAIKDADNMQSQANKNAAQIFNIAKKIRTGPLEKANGDFPDLNDKINTRFAPLSKLEKDSRNNLSLVTAVYQDHTAGSNADYAGFTDGVMALSSNLKKIKIFETESTKE